MGRRRRWVDSFLIDADACDCEGVLRLAGIRGFFGGVVLGFFWVSLFSSTKSSAVLPTLRAARPT